MGGKHSTSTSRVSIPPEVLARYNAVNARAESAANQPFRAFGNTASDYVAQMNAQQNAGIAGINATVGSYQPYMDQATVATQAGMGPAYEGIQNYMSPYIQNVADTTGAMMRQQQEQAQSGALGTAASSGAFGGDRAGIAAANMQQQNQMGYGAAMANIMNQGYTQALGASQADLARQMAGGAQLAGLGAQTQQLGLQGAQAQLAAGTMQQQTEQAGRDAMIQRFMQEQGYPFQVAQFLANIAMGTGAAQGSTTTTETPRNWLGFDRGGRVEEYANGGGVAGPRTYSQGAIGGDSYIPAGDLPVGQLMVAQPPEQQGSGDSINKILELIKMVGAKNGGAINQRHGYADGGGSFTEELRHQQEIRDAVAGLGLADRARSEANARAAMAQKYSNPANSLSPNVVMPNAVSGLVAQPQSANSQNEAWDQPPVRSGQTAARAVPVRSGPTGLDMPERSGPTGLDTPVRGGPTGFDIPVRSGATPMAPVGGLGGPGTFAPGEMPFPHPQPRPEGLGVAAPTPVPAPTPQGGVSGADVAADALRTFNVNPALINGGKNVPEVTGGVNAPNIVNASHFYDTHIIRQESGDNQFDKNGNPLTSSAGAVGAAQVMEATGPEAAKLAGLPWDRDRWLNDKDYNKALGKAYFLDQYKKFGSLDKAAAAYNAGPGAVASAIDRATALGGSYLDYLPDETKNYVHSTIGMDSGASGKSGLGNADMTVGQQAPASRLAGDWGHINKPYDQRNWLGKLFHNQVGGGLNPIAIKALLSGIGSAAEAQTISPLGALLSGIGAGTKTYNELQNQEPKRVADILANNATARLQYQTQVALGETRPFEQWASDQFGNGAQSMTGGPNGNVASVNQTTGGKSVMGVPLDPTGSGFAMPIQLPDGSGTILASQSYAYNSQLADSVARDAALGIPFAQNTLKIAQANIDAIEANKGKVQTTDGRVVDDPTYTSRMFGANSATADLDTSTKLQQALPTMTQNAQNYRRRTDQLATALSTMPSTGPLTGWFSTVGGIANEFGIPVGSDAATGYQTAYKTLADEALTSMADLAGTVDTSTLARQIQGSNPTPEMTPQAIEHVLAIRAAVSDYQVAMADYLNKAMADPSNAGKNLAQLQREFAASNDIANFVAQEDQKYAGVIEPIKPADVDDTTWGQMSKEKKRAWIASENQGG